MAPRRRRRQGEPPAPSVQRRRPNIRRVGETLDAVIEHTRQMIAGYQNQADRYRDELDVLLRAKKRFLMTTSKSHASSVGEASGLQRSPVQAGSEVGQAVSALRKAGKPLHVNRLLEGIKAGSGARPKRSSLVSSITKHARKGQMFYRAAPATYGLLEWRRR